MLKPRFYLLSLVLAFGAFLTDIRAKSLLGRATQARMRLADRVGYQTMVATDDSFTQARIVAIIGLAFALQRLVLGEGF